MHPDLLGQFIMTLIRKGYRVSIDRDSIANALIINIYKYESVQYHAIRTITFDNLNSMTKDAQKAWFDYVIEWVEVEFLNLRRRNENE